MAKIENISSEKSITVWNYYIGSAKQASEFEAITAFLLNYIREQFEYGNDIAKDINDQELVDTKIWRPSLQKSQSEDPEIKEIENEEFKIEF